MKQFIALIFICAMGLGLAFSGCGSKQKGASKEATHTLETEETGRLLTRDQVYDEVRNGSHLVLAYNEESDVFTGTVENVSDKVLYRVRVEVHLSNGTELGPTTQLHLQPGEKRLVLLESGSGDFISWSTHAEVGSDEHSHSHDGEGADEAN